MSIEEVEARRASRRASHDEARAKQEAADLEAIDALEEVAGAPLHTMTTNRFVVGVAYRVAYRAPSAVEYKRYCDMVGRALKGNDHDARLKAQELLGSACTVYPAPGTPESKAMFDAFPGLPISVAVEASKMAELKAEEEGKG